jgi:hypothetical protein
LEKSFIIEIKSMSEKIISEDLEIYQLALEVGEYV